MCRHWDLVLQTCVLELNADGFWCLKQTEQQNWARQTSVWRICWCMGTDFFLQVKGGHACCRNDTTMCAPRGLRFIERAVQQKGLVLCALWQAAEAIKDVDRRREASEKTHRELLQVLRLHILSEGTYIQPFISVQHSRRCTGPF